MTEFIYNGKGAKLSQIINARFHDLSYGSLQKIFRKGDVRVNGKKVYSDIFINNGDTIRIYYKEQQRTFVPFFENDLIACFFKPIQMACSGENSFEKAIYDQYGYIICHRLDTNTEGVVIFAKSQEVFDELKKSFRNHLIEKHYLTAVVGSITGKGELKGFLTKNADDSIVKVTDYPTKGAVEIFTGYYTLYNGRSGSVLDVELITGRTHQIRAHLSHVGHPIIGDPKYCPERLNRYYGKKYQLLRAYKLIFHTKEGLLKKLNGLVVEYDSYDYLENLKLLTEK